MLFRIKISINIIWLSGCEGNFNDVSKKVNFIFGRILLGGEEPHKGEFMGSVFSLADSWVVCNNKIILFLQKKSFGNPKKLLPALKVTSLFC